MEMLHESSGAEMDCAQFSLSPFGERQPLPWLVKINSSKRSQLIISCSTGQVRNSEKMRFRSRRNAPMLAPMKTQPTAGHPAQMYQQPATSGINNKSHIIQNGRMMLNNVNGLV